MLGPVEGVETLFRVILEVVGEVLSFRAWKRTVPSSKRRKSAIYRRGISVPTTAKAPRENDDALN